MHLLIIHNDEYSYTKQQERTIRGSLIRIDKGHGRIEEHYYRQLQISDWVSHSIEWKDLNTVIQVKRIRHEKGKTTEETQLYISSLPLDAQRAGKAIRNHWLIENRVHWVLDMSFNEDDSRIHRQHAPKNIAAILRFVMNLARFVTTI